MSAPIHQDNSPGEPQLSVVKHRPKDLNSTGPSPLMPALSPHPLTRDTSAEDGESFKRRTAAKKMLDFGCPGTDGPVADDGLRKMEDEHILRTKDVQRETSLKEDLSAVTKTTNHQRDVEDLSHPASKTANHQTNMIREDSINQPPTRELPDAEVSYSSPSQSSALKRPHTVSPRKSDEKRIRPASDATDKTAPLSTMEPSPFQTELIEANTADLRAQTEQDQIWSPPFFSRNIVADDANLFPENEAENPENILRCHGINLFEDPTHRQDLIEFCENSLLHSRTEDCTDPNLNNNCGNITDSSHDVPNQLAHAQFDSLVQRVRARGFIVNDATYFDGKQYVPIKVASNGRGKFRLLLPPDHPHRKGVDDEIPILKTFEMDSNCQEEIETGEDSLSENN